MTARHHHYLPQFYLKGFTKGRTKKSKLSVIDSSEKKSFVTIPRNVGGSRDFNRVDVEGVDQNHIESALSKIESKADVALKNIEKKRIFEGEDKELILNLIALLAVRSPEMREQSRKNYAQIAEKVLALTLDSRERWETQKKEENNSTKIENKIDYEDAKKFFESKKYKIDVSREHHIHMEMVGVDAILPHLFARDWFLLETSEDSGSFITTDNPVCLLWKYPEKVPPFRRASPGYGMVDTQVYFPLSQGLVLYGEFNSQEGTGQADKNLVSNLNSLLLSLSYKQIYSPDLNFNFIGKGDVSYTGKDLVKHIKNN
jgi:hypothetical protein